MPRVLLLTQPVDGGVFRHVRDLAATLPAHGYEPVVCGPLTPAQAAEVDAEVVPLELGRAVGPRDAAAVARFARVVRSVRPAVVHAHSSKAGAVARAARPLRPRLPVLYTPHGFAHAGYFERPAERRAYALAERALAPLASRIVCVCEAERRLALAIGAGRRATVVHNGIEPPGDGPVDPTVAAARPAGPVIATVSLLRPGKGVETLLDAFAAVRSSVPAAQLAIAGDGADRAALEARARDLGVGDAVTFLGLVADVDAVLRGADVFVLPSWAESFPYVVLEAMALGLPVAATDVGGVSEVVADGRTGRLVPARDAAALASALTALISGTARADELGARGRDEVFRRFTRDHMASKLAGVYDELLT